MDCVDYLIGEEKMTVVELMKKKLESSIFTQLYTIKASALAQRRTTKDSNAFEEVQARCPTLMLAPLTR